MTGDILTWRFNMPWFVPYQVELKMRLIWRFVPAAVLIVALGQAGRAEAGLVLKLSDTADPVSVTIADNGVGDANPLVGAVTYIGAVGEFGLNVIDWDIPAYLGWWCPAGYGPELCRGQVLLARRPTPSPSC